MRAHLRESRLAIGAVFPYSPPGTPYVPEAGGALASSPLASHHWRMASATVAETAKYRRRTGPVPGRNPNSTQTTALARFWLPPRIETLARSSLLMRSTCRSGDADQPTAAGAMPTNLGVTRDCPKCAARGIQTNATNTSNTLPSVGPPPLEKRSDSAKYPKTAARTTRDAPTSTMRSLRRAPLGAIRTEVRGCDSAVTAFTG